MTNETIGRRYLVTGASGFIGRATCKFLLGKGARVSGVSRSTLDLQHENWEHFQADLTKAPDVDAVFERARPEFVIHLASCVTGARGIEWVGPTLGANLLAAVNVLTAASKSKVSKTVLAGSLEEPDVDEEIQIPSSPYAASKWCASGYARMYNALYGLPVAVARIFMVYGPGQADIKKLIPYVCLSALQGKTPKLMSGKRLVDWIYVDDVVDGLIRMTVTGPVDGSYVDLGSGELVATGEVAAILCRAVDAGLQPQLGAVPEREMEQIRQADVEHSRELLDWHPSVVLKDGLVRTLAWYRDSEEAG